MAKHLQSVTDDEWEDLHDHVVAWLVRHNVAGSIACEYNLYDALDDEREKAQGSGEGDPARVNPACRHPLGECCDGCCECRCDDGTGICCGGTVCGGRSHQATGALPDTAR